jgi:hypothetical protein
MALDTHRLSNPLENTHSSPSHSDCCDSLPPGAHLAAGAYATVAGRTPLPLLFDGYLPRASHLLAAGLPGGLLLQTGAVLKAVAVVGFALAYAGLYRQTNRNRMAGAVLLALGGGLFVRRTIR